MFSNIDYSRLSIISILFFFLTINIFAQNKPVLLYSDLTSGPATGWSTSEPNKGCAVTIWGKNFGDSRDSNFVTINGAKLTSDSDYAEWGVYKPTPFNQRITFWLNSACQSGDGDITVTVDGVTSNTLPFTVRSGNIYFVDTNNPGNPADGSFESPWENPGPFISALIPGDICYVRNGLYDESYKGGGATMYFNSTLIGTEDMPITFAAYPGEEPKFECLPPTYDVNFRYGLNVKGEWIILSKLHIESNQTSIDLGENGRCVGNDCIGISEARSGTGIIATNSRTAKVLGNACHGGRSASRFDHAIYVSGPGSGKGVEVGWNYVYDNSFDIGPMIVVNHQQDRTPPDEYVKSHHIHHNFIDCSEYKSRGIGIFHLSWDVGEDTIPEPSYVYNNVLIRCNMYHANGHAFFFNNTLYNGIEYGFSTAFNAYNRLTSTVVNNIFHMSASEGTDYIIRSKDDTGGKITVSNNIYYGLGDYNPATELTDSNAINAYPDFIDTLIHNFRLDSLSFGIDSGSAEAANILMYDFDGNLLPMNGNFDIGAFEYAVKIESLDTISGDTIIVTDTTFVTDSNIVEQQIDDKVDSVWDATHINGNWHIDDQIIVYPNPFYINYNDVILIRNVTENSKLKILSTSGELLFEDFIGHTQYSYPVIDNYGKRLNPGLYFYLVIEEQDYKTAKNGKLIIY